MENTKRGFTLIELLVVVLIIGILAAVALPMYKRAVTTARLARVDSTLDALQKGIDMYTLAYGNEDLDLQTLSIDIPCADSGQQWCCTNDIGMFEISTDNNASRVKWLSYKMCNQPDDWAGGAILTWEKQTKDWRIIKHDSINSEAVCAWIKDRGFTVTEQSLIQRCKELGVSNIPLGN